MPIPVESSNRSFKPLLTTAGVGEGAKVAGTDDGMKDCPTFGKKGKEMRKNRVIVLKLLLFLTALLNPLENTAVTIFVRIHSAYCFNYFFFTNDKCKHTLETLSRHSTR